MRHSMDERVPRFTAERAVSQYTRDYYLPGTGAYRTRTVDGNALATELATAHAPRWWSC
jgi:starch phosphorylase